MAIDTAARRFSAINPMVPWRGPSVIPDGTIAASDRRALQRLYSGLSAANAYLITPTSGSFAWTGNTAELTPSTRINTAQKRFSALSPGLPWRGVNLFPTGSINAAGRVSLAHHYSGFAITNVNAYTLTAESGSFVWDGEPSFSDFEISCNAGTYAMTGNSATLLATRTAFLTSGVFTMTGRDATLTKFTERTLVPEAGSFAMTGRDVTFTVVRSMTATRGEFNLSGPPINLVWSFADGTVHGQEVVNAGGFSDYGSLTERQKFKKQKIAKSKPAEKQTPVLKTPYSDPRLGLPVEPLRLDPAAIEKAQLEAKQLEAKKRRKKIEAELLL